MITALPRNYLTASDRPSKFILHTSELLCCRRSYLVQPGPLFFSPCSSAVEHSLGKGEVSGSSPDEGIALKLTTAKLLKNLERIKNFKITKQKRIRVEIRA